MVLFPKALFLAPTFLTFHFQNFLKISQQFVFLVQTREKLTHGLLTFLKNILK